MTNFKEWLMTETNFIQFSGETQQGINSIVAKLGQTMKANPSFLGEVGVIPFVDHKGQSRPITVIVKNIRSIGYYDPNDHQVFLNPNLFRNGVISSIVTNVLSHEVTHAVDPKYNPSMPDSYFDKGIAKGQFNSNTLNYEKSPHEFDAFGGGMAADIEKQFNSLDSAGKQELLNTLTNWLKFGGRIPEVIQQSHMSAGVIQTWYSKPTLWRKFQQRMFGLVQKLQSQQQVVQNSQLDY